MASQGSMFSHGQQQISGGNFTSGSGNITVINHTTKKKKLGRQTAAFAKLTNHVAPSALHNSGETLDPPKCHPATRVDLLTVLITWALFAVYEFPIRWINGPAGAGKSAIMRSFAEMLVEKGLLLATFFFFRSDGRRNTVECLIPTIAYQLCLNIPPLQPWIEHAIERNPLIFNTSLSTQIQTLIVDPFLHYFYDPDSTIVSPFPRIIIVDGLDECTGDKIQQQILQMLCRMVQTLPIPIAIVFASRPEHQIRITFELGSLSKLSSRITLDKRFNPDKDIRLFYLAEFAEIQSTHPMRSYLGPNWPSEDILQLLIRNASGQFIYASTIIKFVKSIRHNPALRLQIVLGKINPGKSKPFQQLDALYTVIFLNVDLEVLPDTLKVLGIILTPGGPGHQSPKFIESLLGLPAGHVRFILLDLESILTVTTDAKDIRIYHTSLSDFLFDKSRARKFFTDRGRVYADIASSCINQICGPQMPWSRGDALFQQLLRSYFEAQILVSLQNAMPTDGLHHAIVFCDMAQLITFPELKGASTMILVLLFLVGLKGSCYAGLCQMKLPDCGEFINNGVIEHWIEHDYEDFHGPILITLYLALMPPPKSSQQAIFSALYLARTKTEAKGAAGIRVLPNVDYYEDKDKRLENIGFRTTKDWHLLASIILEIINSPTGLLHDPIGQEACTKLMVEIVEGIPHKTAIQGYGFQYQKTAIQGYDIKYLKTMEKLLPFLLNVSLAQNDLIRAAENARQAVLCNSSSPKSLIVMDTALDSYIQRANNEKSSHIEEGSDMAFEGVGSVSVVAPAEKAKEMGPGSVSTVASEEKAEETGTCCCLII